MRGLCLILALCMALPVTAHENHDPRLELFVALIVEAGCQMTDAQADQIFPPFGFTKSETRGFISVLLFEGQARVEPETNSVVLMTPDCP